MNKGKKKKINAPTRLRSGEKNFPNKFLHLIIHFIQRFERMDCSLLVQVHMYERALGYV